MERSTSNSRRGRSAFMPVALALYEPSKLHFQRGRRYTVPAPHSARRATVGAGNTDGSPDHNRWSGIQSLADRLLNRGLSKLSDDRPEHADDLRLAAKVIRAMARSFGHADIITLENGNG
jgi:hypothetical protein